MNWQISRFEHYYGTNHSASLACLLIPGWGMDSAIFDVLKQGLSQYFHVYIADYHQLSSLSDAAESLAQQLDFVEPLVVVGWSLGGNIALALAERHPEKVAYLCLLASTPSFVARPQWPAGMPAATFEPFSQGLLKHRNKTLQRFDLLQSHGDSQKPLLDKALKTYRAQQRPWSDEDLQQGLVWLEQSQQMTAVKQLSQPQLWCFGDNDALVNQANALALKQLNAKVQTLTIEQSGHMFFLSQADVVVKALLRFVQDETANKQKVAKAFSQAAASYDEAAKVQAWAGRHLLAKTAFSAQQLVLDAGCGTARHSFELNKQTQVIASDLAFGMLQYAQAHSDLPLLNADAEQLPLASACLDGIFSNLAVQWCANPVDLLKEWHRVLKSGSKVYLSTLAQGSLFELQKSFSKADNAPHINFFANSAQWQQYAQSAGFKLTGIEQIERQDEYSSVADVLRSLKKIGAQTILYRQSQGLMSKCRWQIVEKTYQQFYRNGAYPLSYQLLFLCLEKP